MKSTETERRRRGQREKKNKMKRAKKSKNQRTNEPPGKWKHSLVPGNIEKKILSREEAKNSVPR
jgi:hypothetical protein